MLSLFAVSSLLIAVGNSCSIALPPFGTYYISNVQALDVDQYPDQVLLTISRTTQSNTGTIASPRLTFDDATGGPWCKLMNVNDGSVGDVVTCDDYSKLIRDYGTVSASSTSVTCNDNCDGATATCTITRNGEDFTFSDIRFDGSDTDSKCGTDTGNVITIGGGNGIYTAFTIEDISTTYIVFGSNTVGVIFDDSTDPVTTTVIDVELVGNWQTNILPGSSFGYSPQFYYDVRVISVALPCCLCYGATYAQYTIASTALGSKYDQTITFSSIGSDTRIDLVKERGIKADTGFFTDTVTIYDLSDGSSVTFEPNLCDIIVNCFEDPCVNSECPYNPTATCEADYCGGCNARWFCGEQDITTYCDSTPTTDWTCPTPTPTTTTTKTPTITCANVLCHPDSPICVDDYDGTGQPRCVAPGDICGDIASGDCGGCRALCADCGDGVSGDGKNDYGCCGECYYQDDGTCGGYKPESSCEEEISTTEMSTTEMISTEEEEGEECPGLDLAIILFYVFEYDLVQRKCDICLYEQGKRAQRKCERIESFIDGVVDNYSNCLIGVCDYPCTLGELVPVDQDDAPEICGCDSFTCAFASNAHKKYHKIFIVIGAILFANIGWM